MRCPAKPRIALRRARAARRGFSLLELLLALSLAVFVLGLISGALYMQAHALNSRRTQVEEAQLARAVLRRMADDLAGTVWRTELDLSGLESLVGTGAASAAGAADSSGDTGGTGGANEAAADEALESAAANIAGESEPAATPGLYGNQYELQIDVSRLPRLDEYAPGLAAAGAIPSDVKTVAYYLAGDSPAGQASAAFASEGSLQPGSAPGGLIRRELDRSVTLYAVENGSLGELGSGEVLLASEVTALEFRYFDGQTWLTEWDSETEGGLPVAVEIGIAVTASDQPPLGSAAGPGSAAPEASGQARVYRLVVALPTAEAPAAASEEASPAPEEASETTPEKQP